MTRYIVSWVGTRDGEDYSGAGTFDRERIATREDIDGIASEIKAERGYEECTLVAWMPAKNEQEAA